jgi:hypothetical protein
LVGEVLVDEEEVWALEKNQKGYLTLARCSRKAQLLFVTPPLFCVIFWNQRYPHREIKPIDTGRIEAL